MKNIIISIVAGTILASIISEYYSWNAEETSLLGFILGAVIFVYLSLWKANKKRKERLDKIEKRTAGTSEVMT